ncbi:MAG: hypothetical protein QM783_00940 [Phycisphaerales bacterium]
MAQDFLSVPYVVTSEPAAFRGLFSNARFGPGIHALIIGDSQETCPLSYGVNYVPAFNAAWAQHYGVSPRTPLVQPGLSFTYPASEWLVCAQLQPARHRPVAGVRRRCTPRPGQLGAPCADGRSTRLDDAPPASRSRRQPRAPDRSRARLV